jgi:hypothetical protein
MLEQIDVSLEIKDLVVTYLCPMMFVRTNSIPSMLTHQTAEDFLFA